MSTVIYYVTNRHTGEILAGPFARVASAGEVCARLGAVSIIEAAVVNSMA